MAMKLQKAHPNLWRTEDNNGKLSKPLQSSWTVHSYSLAMEMLAVMVSEGS